MTQFREGQEVEVNDHRNLCTSRWTVGKIKGDAGVISGAYYWVQFPDGTRAVFDADHIRAVSSCIPWNDIEDVVNGR